MKLNFKKHKRIFTSLIVVAAILLVMIAVGYPLGILSENPDGLERVIIDSKGESWLESLASPWVPFLSWIENNYIAAIVGIILSVVIIFAIFKFISYRKKSKSEIQQ
jgi:hypothetical protein